MKRMRVDGSDFANSYEGLESAIQYVRKERGPILVHAKDDPIIKLKELLLREGESENAIDKIRQEAEDLVAQDFEKALNAPDPELDEFDKHEFVPAVVNEEKGKRNPQGSEKLVMVDAAMHPVDEIMAKHPQALFY